MTTYYVSNEGSDSNNGLGPDASHATNKPFLTIGKLIAASGAIGTGGDRAYLAPGTYREVVTVGITSPTVETIIEGDPANAQGFKTSGGVLVAPGPVVWTAYTTNDTTTPSTSPTLTLNGRDFFTFKNILFIGGNGTASCIGATTTNSINITIRDCALITNTPAASSQVIVYTGLADIASNWLIDRCVIWARSRAVGITLPTSASADYDTNFVIQNCLIISGAGSTIFVTTTGAGAFKGGGVDVSACTILGGATGVSISSANLSTSIPCTILNSLVICGSGTGLSANTAGQLTENYCLVDAQTARTNVTTGANSQTSPTYSPMLHLGQELIFGQALRPFLMPMAGSPYLGFGSSGAPAVDALNRPRPGGGASTSNAVGYLERHDTAAKETSVVDAGSNAVKITGPGDHDLFIPVDASSTTITVRVRYDTNHSTTNKPQATILNGEEIGVTTETKTAAAGVDTWETLTFSSFTPTAKGFVTLRLISRSAAGNGIAYFDTVTGGGSGSQGLDYFRRGEPLQAAVAGAAAAGGLLVHPGTAGRMNG